MGKILTHKIRLTIAMFLVASFFAISPLIILYTTGYRYDLKNYQILQTGVLNIDAKPNNLNLFINNVQIKKDMPVYLPNRAPGTYEIKLTLPGYHDWKKDMTVESKKTTYIKNITLFKQSLPTLLQLGIKNEITDIFSSYTGEFLLLLSKENSVYEITLLDVASLKTSSLLRVKTEKAPSILWSPFNNTAAVITSNPNDTVVQLFNPNNQESSPAYSFQTEITDFQWSKNTLVPSLYIQAGNEINELNFVGKSIIYSIEDTEQWYVDEQNKIWKAKDNSLISPYQEQNLSLNRGVKKIIDINDKRAIFKTNDDVVVIKINNSQIEEIHQLPTTNIIFNAQTEEWISWSESELWTIYADGSVSLLNRTSDKMKHVSPLDKYGVLLLASDTQILGFNPGYYTSQELFNNGKIEQINAFPKQRKIFFLGEVGQKQGMFELEY